MEVAVQPDRVLLPVEDNGPLRAAKAGQGCGGGIQVEAGLHPHVHEAASGRNWTGRPGLQKRRRIG